MTTSQPLTIISNNNIEISSKTYNTSSYNSDNNSSILSTTTTTINNVVVNDNNHHHTDLTTLQTIKVESCTKEFFSKHCNESYPMYKMPRGSCLIINVYNINGMQRRWSNLDIIILNQLFTKLFFDVTIYTDLDGHDLSAKNFMEILKSFAQSSKHLNAQSCILCLMSHGEEGSLTAQDGGKIYLDQVYNLFSNINCPNLAGKPKLFFIQCCRDDPVLGPVDDPGCQIDLEPIIFDEEDECDSLNHLPTMSDMLIGFPSQKGYTAFRKPHVGSWYMNALVDIFSKHAKDTDLCSMLNMVNGCVAKEVTNKGKKTNS